MGWYTKAFFAWRAEIGRHATMPGATIRMRQTNITVLLLLLLGLSTAAAAPAENGKPPGRARAAAAAPAAAEADADDDLPGEREIRRAFEAGDYKGALQMLSRVVNLRGEAGAAYDKHEMWMLKAESHLRLKQLKPAGEAFAAAARETDDPVRAATARATRRLLEEAKAFRITRRVPVKGAKVKSADLLDPEDRADALTILYEDERAATRPKMQAARKSRKLPPIAEALKRAEGLHDLELAATGGDADLTQLRRDLAERAVTLMSKELDRLEKDVEAIREMARQPVERRRRRVTTFGGGYGGASEEVTSRPRGLLGDDAEDLRAVMKTCRQIIDAAESLASAMGEAEPDDVTTLVERATDIGEAAGRVLDGRYGGDD